MPVPIHYPLHAARTRRSRQRHARQEGIVMLVVMLVLMLATASAAVSVQTTQSELRASGEDRMAQQADGASEAAALTTLAWFDELALGPQWQLLWDSETGPGSVAPNMSLLGEPALVARNYAWATKQSAQLPQRDGTEMPAISRPQTGADPAAEPDPLDAIGSFGPRHAYVPSNFAAFINDCAPAPAGLSPGFSVTTTPGKMRYYCVMTARAHMELPVPVLDDSNNRREWVYDNPVVTYRPDPFRVTSSTRVMLLTPELDPPPPP